MGSACGGSLGRGHAQVGSVDAPLPQDQAKGPGQAGSSTGQAGSSTAPSTGVRQGTPIVVEEVKEGVPPGSVASGAIPAVATVLQPGATAAQPGAGKQPGGAQGGSAAGSPGGGSAATGSAADPTGQAGPVCGNPSCQKPASGYSAYCSLECMDKANVPQKAATPPSQPPKIDPKNDAVVFRDPRSQFGDSVGVVGFYYPDREEDCDKICGAGFLGNFWETPEKIRLVAKEPGPKAEDREHHFRNAEAAFQALKFWGYARDFEELTGDGAFLLKRQRQGFEDFTYGGKGDNWKGMRAVLDSKFSQSAMAEAICKTGDTFLLEHNSVKGRDDTWSDNFDGEGKNWLGMQLMLVRDKLAGRKEWTDFISGLVSLETGAPLDTLKGRQWQDAVRNARNALMVKVDEIRPKLPCSRVGCGKPSWNNQPGEYCSKDCRKTICQKYGCGKPSWNGKMMDYCSKACRQADNLYWTTPTYGNSYGTSYNTYGLGNYGLGNYGTSAGTSHYGTSAGTSHTGSHGSYGTSGTSHTGSYGTSAASGSGAHSSSYGTGGGSSVQASAFVCKTHGCGKPTWNGKPHEYCSKTCKEATLAKASGGVAAGGSGAGSGASTSPGGGKGVGGGAAAAPRAGAGGTQQQQQQQQQPAMPEDGPAAPADPGSGVQKPKKKRWGLF